MKTEQEYQLDGADRLTAIARRAAAEAAAAVRAEPAPYRYTGTINAGGDRVLLVDLAADQAIQRVLHDELGTRGLPYAVVSEESGVRRFGGDYPLFVVDPVDGSAQARRRHPDCVVSVAVALGPLLEDIVVGVVQPIAGGPPFSAVRGAGAWYGETPLPLTPIPEGPGTALLIEGMYPATVVPLAVRFAAEEPGWQLHVSGAIAYQLSLLGAGCYDVLVAAQPGGSAHDIAAGWLIVQEAGMIYTDLGGVDTAQTALTDRTIRHQSAAARRPDLLARALRIAGTVPPSLGGTTTQISAGEEVAGPTE
jgi:myo-inositol-1(or 4)-monophosphatase